MEPQQLLEQAAVDRRLGNRHVRLLVVLAPHLCFSEFRPMKHRELAASLRLGRASISRYAARLVVCGYLQCRPYIGRVSWYRLAIPSNEASTAPRHSITLSRLRD